MAVSALSASGLPARRRSATNELQSGTLPSLRPGAGGAAGRRTTFSRAGGRIPRAGPRRAGWETTRAIIAAASRRGTPGARKCPRSPCAGCEGMASACCDYGLGNHAHCCRRLHPVPRWAVPATRLARRAKRQCRVNGNAKARGGRCRSLGSYATKLGFAIARNDRTKLPPPTMLQGSRYSMNRPGGSCMTALPICEDVTARTWLLENSMVQHCSKYATWIEAIRASCGPRRRDFPISKPQARVGQALGTRRPLPVSKTATRAAPGRAAPPANPPQPSRLARRPATRPNAADWWPAPPPPRAPRA